MAGQLLDTGYRSEMGTLQTVERLRRFPVSWCASGQSARYLRETGREEDVLFTLNHVDDLNFVLDVRAEEACRYDVNSVS